MSGKNIGFLGLGTMGAPMARNLLRNGYAVCGFDPNPDALARHREAGGTTAGSPREAADGADVVIGPGGLFHPGVRIGDRVSFGARAIVHPNAVIGSDGFSFAPDLNSPLLFSPGVMVKRVHSIGNVEIGDDVEIGACTTIDRSTLETTRIGSGTKIDNHVHIGHNVAIGDSCIICGMVGISGSVTIGNRVRLGGGAGVADHVKIGDQATVAAGSAVAGNVSAGAFVSGLPAMPHERTLENFHYMTRQKRLHGKVDDINARLEALERTIRSNGG